MLFVCFVFCTLTRYFVVKYRKKKWKFNFLCDIIIITYFVVFAAVDQTINPSARWMSWATHGITGQTFLVKSPVGGGRGWEMTLWILSWRNLLTHIRDIWDSVQPLFVWRVCLGYISNSSQTVKYSECGPYLSNKHSYREISPSSMVERFIC